MDRDEARGLLQAGQAGIAEWNRKRETEEAIPDLSETILISADLRGADLRGVKLSGAYLSDADLRRAKLSGANLANAYLSGADLSGADLSEAILSEAILSEADLSGADLATAKLNGTKLNGAKIGGAILSEIVIDAEVADLLQQIDEHKNEDPLELAEIAGADAESFRQFLDETDCHDENAMQILSALENEAQEQAKHI